ncbi:RipT-effector family protein [Ralstonia solanacearum]|nr:type III effector protein ript [Ralstonia solanacearum]AXV96503.1 type III effector protein ript [Ralstonia solanacearum]AXW01717.1 type III effector protein ript [Ralstonia solanacearum]NJZ81095.1 RipT-effector family protein [Ralstonia solanacearum]NKA75879.1 RipT-effector family protein [Ralstonia solanacearum]
MRVLSRFSFTAQPRADSAEPKKAPVAGSRGAAARPAALEKLTAFSKSNAAKQANSFVRSPLPLRGDRYSSEPGVLPSAGQFDAHIWDELPTQMAQCAVARTRQGLAFRARFGAESAQHYSGSCVGLSAVWIRLHEAAPATHAVNRVNTAGSFDGMAHAEVYQRAYEANQSDMLQGRASKRFGKSDMARLDAIAQEQPSQILGLTIGTEAYSHKSVGSTARVLTEFDGYGLLALRMAGSRGAINGHAAALHRQPGSSHITFFEPNLGEFHIPLHDTKDFLQAYAGMQKSLGQPVSQFDLLPVGVHGSIHDTPLQTLAHSLVS